MLSTSPTTQEAYEHIREYFSRPGAKLARDHKGGACYYRDEYGNKCAVGCMIPDEVYDTPVSETDDGWVETLGDTIEGNNILGIYGETQLHELLNGESEEGQKKLSFLEHAQKLHDNEAEDVLDFLVGLDKLAESYDLVIR